MSSDDYRNVGVADVNTNLLEHALRNLNLG